MTSRAQLAMDRAAERIVEDFAIPVEERPTGGGTVQGSVGLVPVRAENLEAAAGAPLWTFHLPGKHDQSTHGKSRGERFDSATSGTAAVQSVAYQPSGAIREALIDYGGEGPDSYAPINRGLRTGDNLTRRQRGHVAALDQAMQESSAPTDLTVYRNIRGMRTFGLSRDEIAESDLTGLTWRDQGFVSTGTNGFVPGPTSIQMRILVPKGTKAISYSEKNRKGGGGLDLDEILLGRGLTFRVVADHGRIDGPRRIDIEVVKS